MFGALVEEIRLEAVKKDTTNALPAIMDKGRRIVTHMQHSGNYSRSKLRKLGIIPNPHKKKGSASR
jgi:hypothetical protein